MNVRICLNRARRKLWIAASALTAASLLLTSVAVSSQAPAEASSHREAPLISQDAYADNTDTYVFVSPANPDNVVLVASWIPFEGPEGGPNYFEWGKDVLYDIHVDNNGDAVADFTYTLSSETTVQNPLTFLYNVGPIGPDGSNWNRQQRYSVVESTANGTKMLLDKVLAPPVNIGSKSTSNYGALADNFIYTAQDGGDNLKIYAGQTDDAFWVDLQVFDLLTLRGQQPPIGYGAGNNSPVDSVAGFNNHSLVIEVPISRLTANGEPVLGVWATARRPAMRVLNGAAGLGSLTNSGDAVQLSRLGMPLVNEVVLPYALKDAFNSISPDVDLKLYTNAAGLPDPTGAQVQEVLQKSVEDPEIGRLLCGLYGVPLPGDADDNCSTEVQVGTPRSGRGDIFDIFLTGMVLAAPFTINTANGPVTLPAGFNVNRPANAVPAEMIRINTNIKGDLCAPTPSRLGVLGGDACGFPNGRRLLDDTVEIELLAVAGAAYPVLDGRDAGFTFNPGLIDVLDDGIDFNDVPFRPAFPYMGLAQSGQEHIHQNPAQAPVVQSTAALIMNRKDDAEEKKNGEVSLTSKNLELGERHGQGRTVGLRFSNLDIPAGATVVNAYIQFFAAEKQTGPASLTFRAQAADDAPTFEHRRFNISSRPTTAQSVTWNDVPAWDEVGDTEWSPNLSAIVQEVVGRPGWQQGNDLAVIVTGSGQRTARAYDGGGNAAPCLIVEYIVDGVAGAAAVEVNNSVTSVVGSTLLLGNRTMPTSDIDANDEMDATETLGAVETGNVVDAANVIFLPLTQNN